MKLSKKQRRRNTLSRLSKARTTNMYLVILQAVIFSLAYTPYLPVSVYYGAVVMTVAYWFIGYGQVRRVDGFSPTLWGKSLPMAKVKKQLLFFNTLNKGLTGWAALPIVAYVVIGHGTALGVSLFGIYLYLRTPTPESAYNYLTGVVKAKKKQGWFPKKAPEPSDFMVLHKDGAIASEVLTITSYITDGTYVVIDKSLKGFSRKARSSFNR